MITIFQLTRRHDADETDHNVEDSSRIAAGSYEEISDLDVIAKAQTLVDDFISSGINLHSEERCEATRTTVDMSHKSSWTKMMTVGTLCCCEYVYLC